MINENIFGCPFAIGGDGRLYYDDNLKLYAYDFKKESIEKIAASSSVCLTSLTNVSTDLSPAIFPIRGSVFTNIPILLCSFKSALPLLMVLINNCGLSI